MNLYVYGRVDYFDQFNVPRYTTYCLIYVPNAPKDISNVIAGTDCGLGYRVGHEEIMWAKLEAMVEGARIASKQLWVSR